MNDIHQKAKKGIKLLLGRQAAVQILTFAGGVVLARGLGPAQFGLYVIANSLVMTLALLGDFGLSLSLVQRKAELTDADLRVGFTLQLILTSIVVVAILIAAPWLVTFYPKAPAQTIWLVRALAFNLYLTSWRSISVLQLERHLHFDKLAKIEVAEILAFQGLAVVLALSGCGVWSYVAASLAQGILGTGLLYAASPWPIRLSFNRQIAASILRYGLPFQTQAIVNSMGSWITPFILGGLVGPLGLGYVTWASSNGKKPMFLASCVMRVAFPHFARIQDDRAEVERILIRYLTFMLLPAGLWFSVLLTAGPSIVTWIYSAKWTPAVPSLCIFAAALSIDMVSTVVGMTLNGLGLVSFCTRVVLVRSVMAIVLTLFMVPHFGFNGVAAAYLAAAAVTTPWLAYGLGKGPFLRITRSMLWQCIPTVVSIGAGFALVRISSVPEIQACITAVGVSLIFALSALAVSPRWLKALALDKLARRSAPATVSVSPNTVGVN